MTGKSREEVEREFREVVNMGRGELEEFLGTPESQSVGFHQGEEAEVSALSGGRSASGCSTSHDFRLSPAPESSPRA